MPSEVLRPCVFGSHLFHLSGADALDSVPFALSHLIVLHHSDRRFERAQCFDDLAILDQEEASGKVALNLSGHILHHLEGCAGLGNLYSY